MTIAADSPRQPYEQLSDFLRRQIRSGEIRPGEKLPSVRQLADKHGTTTTTVQKALHALRNEGLILISGRGSFARNPEEAQAGDDVRGQVEHLTSQVEELSARVAELERRVTVSSVPD